MNLEGNRRWVPLRIRVIEVNFGQKKRNLVRVNGEFGLSEFELSKKEMKVTKT